MKVKDDNNTTKKSRIDILNNEEKSAGGYTLFAPQTGNGKVILINMQGKTEHEWNFAVRPGRDAVILNHGNLGYNGSHEKSLDLYPAWDIWHGGHFMEVTPVEILFGNMKTLIITMTLSGCITDIYSTQLHHLSLSEKGRGLFNPKVH